MSRLKFRKAPLQGAPLEGPLKGAPLEGPLKGAPLQGPLKKEFLMRVLYSALVSNSPRF